MNLIYIFINGYLYTLNWVISQMIRNFSYSHIFFLSLNCLCEFCICRLAVPALTCDLGSYLLLLQFNLDIAPANAFAGESWLLFWLTLLRSQIFTSSHKKVFPEFLHAEKPLVSWYNNWLTPDLEIKYIGQFLSSSNL